MKKLLKSKKGMTLVELLAGMLIFTIIAAASSVILSSMLKASIKANDLAEYSVLLDNAANQMISDMSEAASLDIGSSTITINNPNNIEYTIGEGGDLQRNGSPVFSEEYYKNKKIGFTCKDLDNGAYVLTVVLIGSDEAELISRDYAVKPLALN